MTPGRDIQEAHDQLLVLASVTVKLADVHRTILYPDGHRENDCEHSFHLALSAVELAVRYYPGLDIGLVSQFSAVHDLPEAYAGDVPSFKRTKEARIRKEEAERRALERLYEELPPYTASLLRRYETQEEPEARFVRLIDKILPAIIHAVAPDANREYFFKQFNIRTIEDVDIANQHFVDRLREMFPEFDFALLLREAVARTSRERIFEGWSADENP